MKKLFKIKPLLWLVLAIIIGLGINFLIIELRLSKDIKTAQAGDEHSVSGFAWNGIGLCSDGTGLTGCNSDADCIAPDICVITGAGWISFNSTDCDTNANGYVDSGICEGNDDASTPAFNYGVHINNGNGNFSGYAWSSTVGWISFEENDPPDFNFSSNCNDTPSCNDATDNCTACLDVDGTAGNGVYGWAKILSMGDDGWIRLNDDGSGFLGVSWDTGTDELGGWAWNNRGLCDDGSTNCVDNTPCGAGTCDLSSIGIGWISFNCNDNLDVCESSTHPRSGLVCEDQGSNSHKWCDSRCSDTNTIECDDNEDCPGVETCEEGKANGYKCVDFCTFFSSYAVTLDLKPSQPVIYEVIPNPNDKCHGLMVRWLEDTGSSQTDFRIYRQDNDFPFLDNLIGTEAGNTYQHPDYSPELSPGDHFYYFVDAFDSNVPIASEMSEPLDGTTYWVCKVSGSAINGAGECPNKITLSWPEDPHAGYYNIIRCNLTDTDDCDDFNNYYGNNDYTDSDWSQLPGDDLYESMLTQPMPDDCYSPDSSHCVGGICSCVDEEISAIPADGEMYAEYVYKIQTASSTIGQFSSWSDSSASIRPCTLFPTWREVR
ncbi:hypothetical protein DRH27_02770 [Candidatus Falkowbacteria bacterium]|nr:MAG: hypothetical protein DRH27_02770 [Candidatus Falkowbacteria bacterium]